ncbi:hypothetical protein CEXT_105091 [Caerostris extrusa]|uniref:Sialin n=1 Tax=Caerostris extrusa TaxID=172846 RepID=A0AAV4Q878_CAEEX|nr:hypothetical protein CEXT_105091 [Caerostris extrusa]
MFFFPKILQFHAAVNVLSILVLIREVKKRADECELPGVRYLFALNAAIGYCAIYALRMNISVAIVAMVNQTAIHDNPGTNVTSDDCPAPSHHKDFSNSTEISEDGEFVWSREMQGVVLGAFYYGYCFSQIPGGRLAEVYSGKWVFGISTLIVAVLTLLTPLAARFGVEYLIAIRALEGLAQGVTLPAINYMVGQWAPDSEKGVLNTLVHAGVNVGTIVAMPLTAFLCDSGLFGGWPSAFYIIGLFGCLWFIMWSTLVTDSPLTHPLISKEELRYITSNQKVNHTVKVRSDVSEWFLFILASCDTDDCWFNCFFGCGFSDSKRNFSLTFIRKFCNSVSGFGGALGLVGVCLAGCDVTLNKFFFILSIAIAGFAYCGHVLSLLDMAPEFVGTLMGISNTISSLTGFITPLVVGALTEEQNTLHQWRIVFIITSVLLVIATFAFIFFSSSEKQDWADQIPSEVILDLPQETKKAKKNYTALSNSVYIYSLK